MEEGRLTTATVLVCDVVASTEQRTALGDDAADQLAVVLDRVLRSTVAGFRGDVVKSTGDGLMAVFEAASDALGAAVTVHQEIERRNRDVPEPERLRLRVGLSAGDVHFVAHDCHGTPVVEAARLEGLAEPGSIYTTGLVRLLAGNRGGHRFEPLGSLELKGLAPVEAFRVLWESLPGQGRGDIGAAVTPEPTRIPLPGRLAVGPRIGVIGYEAERRVMSDAMERVAAGEGRELLLISAEAGQGKTTIAGALARDAFADGVCVLFGHCEEDLATPYQLFAEALGAYVARAPENRLREHVAVHGPELVRLVPGLANRIRDLPASRVTDPETERFLVFAAAAGLLSKESEYQPVLLVLDDIQWADKGSLQLLGHLLAQEVTTRILVIAAFRDSGRGQVLREALGMLQRYGGLSRVELRGLDEAGVVAYIEASAGHSLDEDELRLARAVFRETDGNPFYLSQVLRHLVETNAIHQDPTGRWVADSSITSLALPESVRDVIGGRVVRLGERAERMLALAAVIGRDFDLELLEAAMGVPEDELVDLLDAAASAALVRESSEQPGDYHFAHALIQHTLYEDLGPTRRAFAHRQVAEALEVVCAGQPDARLGELARHWANASPVNRAKSIAYARLAGEAALRSLAPSDALRYYADALDSFRQAPTPDPVLGIDLAIGLGTAQRQVGDPAFRATLLDAAQHAVALADTDRLVAAALATHRGLFSNFGAIDPERIAVFEDALARLPGDDPRRALILATYCLEIVVGSSLERRQELAEEALAIAEATGDDEVIVRVLNNCAYALMSPPMLEQSLARTSEALVRAERLGDPVLHFFAANWRRQACAQAGETEDMTRCTDTMRALVERLNQPTLTWVHVFGLAWLALARGDTDEAEQLASHALEIGTQSGQPDASFIYGGQLMLVHHQRGTLDALSPLIEEMATDTPSLAGVLRGALAVASMEAGRTEEARARLQAFADAHYRLEMNPVWITGMAFFADAAIELDDPTYAAPLFDLLVPWADQWSDNGATAANPISHYLGGLATVLGRYDGAERYLAQSAAMCTRAGACFFLAETELIWGRMLAARGSDGDAEAAAELLTKVRDTAVGRGYASVQRRADRALGSRQP